MALAGERRYPGRDGAVHRPENAHAAREAAGQGRGRAGRPGQPVAGAGPQRPNCPQAVAGVAGHPVRYGGAGAQKHRQCRQQRRSDAPRTVGECAHLFNLVHAAEDQARQMLRQTWETMESLVEATSMLLPSEDGSPWLEPEPATRPTADELVRPRPRRPLPPAAARCLTRHRRHGLADRARRLHPD